jgi:Fe-S-cluster containining protein
MIGPEEVEFFYNAKKDGILKVLSFLKKERSHKVDYLFSKHYLPVKSSTDCTICARCCKLLEAGLDQEDIVLLSSSCHMEPKTFLGSYVGFESSTNTSYIKNKPCPFLSGNLCSHYLSRPKACADYPGLERPDIKYRLRSVQNNASVCPIVANTLIRIAQEIGLSLD